MIHTINDDKIVLLYGHVENSIHDWLMLIIQLCTYLKYIITRETFQCFTWKYNIKSKQNFSMSFYM